LSRLARTPNPSSIRSPKCLGRPKYCNLFLIALVLTPVFYRNVFTGNLFEMLTGPMADASADEQQIAGSVAVD